MPGPPCSLKERDVPKYAADHMLLIIQDEDTDAFRKKLMTRKVWRQLVQEQGRKLHLVPISLFWLDDGASLERQLDLQVHLLTSGEWIQQYS